jgi:hypothetical protein
MSYEDNEVMAEEYPPVRHETYNANKVSGDKRIMHERYANRLAGKWTIRKSILAIFTLLFYCSGFSVCAAGENSGVQYKAIDIYIYDWNVLTRASLNESDVRERHGIYIQYSDETDIRNMVSIFFAGELEDGLMGVKPDVRVVVDFISKNGEKHTLLMDKGYIFNRQLTLFKKANDNLVKYLDGIMNTDLRAK